MAKRRGAVSPLGNTAGSADAQKNAAKANIDSLANQLDNELQRSGEDAAKYLAERFGIQSVGQQYCWELASGKSASFSELTLSYEQVKKDTIVTFDVNGRDQNSLTPESLSDLNSLEKQQFYPAVGHEKDGRIDILDGSRRRAWFLQQEGRVEFFRILVTKDELSFSDAKALAKQLQTAKEHNLREIGLQCLALKDSDVSITQAEIAKVLGISQAGVSKAIKAASVDIELVSLFPIVNDLSHPDYTLLHSVQNQLQENGLYTDFIKETRESLCHIQAEYSAQDQKEPILFLIKKSVKALESKQEKDKTIITKLAEFQTKGVFARKKVKGRNFSYEFGRLSKDVQNELDLAIAKVLEQYKGD